MKVILGHIFDSSDGRKVGEEFYITDPAAHPVPTHPAAGRPCKDHFEFLAFMNQSPQARTVGGWDVITRLEGEIIGKTRWQRMVEACNHPDADAQHKALKLTGK